MLLLGFHMYVTTRGPVLTRQRRNFIAGLGINIAWDSNTFNSYPAEVPAVSKMFDPKEFYLNELFSGIIAPDDLILPHTFPLLLGETDYLVICDANDLRVFD